MIICICQNVLLLHRSCATFFEWLTVNRSRWYSFSWKEFSRTFSVHFSLLHSLETFIFCRNLPGKLIHGLIKRDRVSFYNGQGYLGSMEYACTTGFELIGHRIVRCQNGRWTPMPQCVAKNTCPSIDEYPPNSIVIKEYLIPSNNDLRYVQTGSSIYLRCQENFQFERSKNQTLIIQCLPGGAWTPMESCKGIISFVHSCFHFHCIFPREQNIFFSYSNYLWLSSIVFTTSIKNNSNELSIFWRGSKSSSSKEINTKISIFFFSQNNLHSF